MTHHPLSTEWTLRARRPGWYAASLLLALAALAVTRLGSAAGASDVPADIQAELVAKLARYDRNFEERAGPVALVFIVSRSRNADSSLAASVTKAAFGRVERIGGRPHREVVLEYQTAAQLAQRVREERASIVYLTPGLDDQIEAVGTALAGGNVLSLGAESEYVSRGAVLGFELVSGKPKVLLNLPQARKQNIDFSSDVLKLMRVLR